MYHLFNSVYVDSEARIDRRFDTITISPQIGFEHVVDEWDRDQGRQLGYATSLEEYEEDPKAFFKLFKEALESKDKVMVYGDGETYLRLYTMVVKSILPHVTKDVFKWILFCKKASFNTAIVASGEPRVDVLKSIVINAAEVEKWYKFKDPLQEQMDELLALDENALSLEWHILKLITQNKTGKIPRTLKNILRRIALSNSHDALEVWGRQLTRQEFWETAGADIDTLLGGETVFEGCLNFPHMASPQFLRPGMYDYRPSSKWLADMLEEAAKVMDMLEDESSAKRARLIAGFITSTDDLTDPVNCLKRVKAIFVGENRIALAQRDTGKYDENLIRYFLREKVSTLKKAAGDDE